MNCRASIFPSLEGRGGCAVQKYREATLVRADGAKRERDSAKHKIVVRSVKAFRPDDFAGLTTPSARTKVASRYFLTAHPPLLFKEGNMLARQFITPSMTARI